MILHLHKQDNSTDKSNAPIKQSLPPWRHRAPSVPLGMFLLSRLIQSNLHLFADYPKNKDNHTHNDRFNRLSNERHDIVADIADGKDHNHLPAKDRNHILFWADVRQAADDINDC